MREPVASSMIHAHWEHFEHMSDIGIRGIGPTCAQAFEQAATALTAVITDPLKVLHAAGFDLVCSAPAPDLLLVRWLNIVIGEMNIRKMIFGRFRVVIEKDNLTSTVWGELIVQDRHQPAAEVKAATHAELDVRRLNNGSWLAQCIVDV